MKIHFVYNELTDVYKFNFAGIYDLWYGNFKDTNSWGYRFNSAKEHFHDEVKTEKECIEILTELLENRLEQLKLALAEIK